MTFSIVGRDGANPDGAEWGVAVASKFLAVGSVVPWAQAGSGAIATQALANVSYGPDGLERLTAGRAAAEVVAELTATDDEREHRQLGIVDGAGRSATFTGADCLPWAGGVAGDGFSCQGNILTGPEVVTAMVEAFSDPGDLAGRLLASLHAGDRAGGDSRGRQSAALLVVRQGGGYLGDTDVAIDLRVDDHPDPVVELARLLELHRLLFPTPASLEFVDIDEPVAAELRARLRERSLYDGPASGPYDEELRTALFTFVGIENLELRWTDEPRVEFQVLAALRSDKA
jgi:uncharacterized Ntn-hydrolase superfamily protein